jgi:hypothetical protein
VPGWSYADANTNGNCYSNRDVDTHDNSYSYADGYSRAQSYPQAAADPAPEAVSPGAPFLCRGSCQLPLQRVWKKGIKTAERKQG